jgi:hypothetical protein
MLDNYHGIDKEGGLMRMGFSGEITSKKKAPFVTLGEEITGDTKDKILATMHLTYDSSKTTTTLEDGNL